MTFRVRQTIGHEYNRVHEGTLAETLKLLYERRVWFSAISTIPLGSFKEFAGPYGANWKVERIS